MSISIYAASVPTFVGYLERLSGFLDKADAHAKAKGGSVAELLNARLAPDMFTLIGQVQQATAFAKNAAGRLAGLEPPFYDDVETNLANTKARIARAIEYVKSIPAAAFDGAETRAITFRTGPESSTTVSGQDYLLNFALPNFYFHVTTAYAILRHNGVAIGKLDYLGGLPK